MIVSSSFQGLETLLVDTPEARCEISLFGAQVLSYIPKADGRDLLWCSPAKLAPGRPVRGGIPLCWPWFSRQNVSQDLPQHGFVRTLNWRLSSSSTSPNGVVSLRFEPIFPTTSLPADWPNTCTVSMELEIGARLTQTLSTTNRSEREVLLTQALHTYFRVGDVNQVGLTGLENNAYLDKLQDFAKCPKSPAWRFEQSCDRIYLDTAGLSTIVDSHWKRHIHIQSRHSQATIVWNPGAQGVLAFDDIPHTDWPQYLCVEVANCSPNDAISLAPGASHQIQQILSAAPLP